MSFPGGPILAPRPGSTNTLQVPVLNARPRQARSPTHRLPRVMLSPQTPPDTALKTRPSHQRDKTQPHPPECRPHSLPPGVHTSLKQPQPPGADTWRASVALQAVERRPQTQQVRQNETTEEYVADEEARYKPTRLTKQRENGQST